MRIAVSSTGKDLTSEVTYVFGRCPYFVIVDVEENKIKDFKSIENTSSKQTGGAGISAAQTVAEQKVNTVITGNLGPRASSVLKQFKIKTYKGSGSIKEVIDLFIENKLERIE